MDTEINRRFPSKVTERMEVIKKRYKKKKLETETEIKRVVRAPPAFSRPASGRNPS